MPNYADLVLIKGDILTMNPDQPNAEAVAVKGKKIMRVGTNQEISDLIGEKTQIITLNGKTVLPGFIDTHIHVVDYGRLLSWLNLENAESIKEIQSQLSQRIKQSTKGAWILGKNLAPEKLNENRSITRTDLDFVSPQNPIVLYYRSGQKCVVNSKAIEEAKISTQENPGIERDAKTGAPTGIFQDDATNLVWDIIPEPPLEELYASTKLALQKILEAGVTCIHWIVLSEKELPVIKRIAQDNLLNVKVYLIIPAKLIDNALNTFKEIKNENIKLGAGIIFSDGYLASRTAALSQPYTDDPGKQGKLLCTQKELLALAEKIQTSNLQLIIHAVGDKAVETALNTIEATKNNRKILPRLEQAAILNEKLIQQIKKQNIIVSIQPCVVASEFSVWSAFDRLGKNRVKWLFPVKTLLENNIVVVAGSDCPMEPLDPFLGIKTAIQLGNQKVTFLQALSMYTIDAASASNEQKNQGSIQVGKLANLVVLKKPVENRNAEENSVLYTIFNGKIVCSKN